MGVRYYREKAITVLAAIDYDNTVPNLTSTHSHVYMCVVLCTDCHILPLGCGYRPDRK